MAKISKVNIGGTEFDLDAAYLGGLSAQEWEEMIDAHQSSIYGPYTGALNPEQPSFGEEATVLYDGSTAYNAGPSYDGAIYLFNQTHDTNPYYEWIIVNTGTAQSPAYKWKCIGSTSTDLQGYVKKGTYTTASPVSDLSGDAVPVGENPVETEGAIYEITESYDTTKAKIYTPIKTSDDGDHTHTATLPVLTQTFSGFYSSADRKYLYHRVTTVGTHTHDILVSRNTVVTSWSATVTGEVLSFSMATTNLPHVVPTESEGGNEYLYTGEGGSHYHSLQLASSTTATSPSSTPAAPLQYIEDVAKAPTFTIYYAGVSSATDTMSASVSTTGSHSHTMNTASYSNTVYYTQWTMPFAIKAHTHNYQHYHSISHTHSVDLTVDPNA